MVRSEDIEVSWSEDRATGISRCTARLRITGFTECPTEILDTDVARGWVEEGLRSQILAHIFSPLNEPLLRLGQAAPAAYGPPINPEACAEVEAAMEDFRAIMRGLAPPGGELGQPHPNHSLEVKKWELAV